MKKKNLTIIALSLVCLIGAIGVKLNHSSNKLKTVEVKANYVTYDNEQKLYDFADIIAIGSVSTDLKDDKVVTTKNDMGHLDDFYTVTAFNIQKLIKGDIKDKTIYINQPVAITKDTDNSNIKVELEGYSELKKNSKYVLYLKKSSNGNYSIISVTQGKINLDDTDSDEKEKATDSPQLKQLKEQVLKKIK